MSQLFNIDFVTVQDHPSARSISDDDLCATCQRLAYCPGDNSLCQIAYDTPEGVWPCLTDSSDTVVTCEQHLPVVTPDDNWVDITPGS